MNEDSHLIINNNINSSNANILKIKNKLLNVTESINEFKTEITALEQAINSPDGIINTGEINTKKGTIDNIESTAPDNSIVNKKYVDDLISHSGDFNPELQIDLKNNRSLTTKGTIEVGVDDSAQNPQTILNPDGSIITKSININNTIISTNDNNELTIDKKLNVDNTINSNKIEAISGKVTTVNPDDGDYAIVNKKYVDEHGGGGGFNPDNRIDLNAIDYSLTTKGGVLIGVDNNIEHEKASITKDGTLNIIKGYVNNVDELSTNSIINKNYVDNTISPITTRLDTAETNISTNTTNITNLTNRLDTAETNISTNTTNITNLTNRLETDENNISSNTTNITNLSNKLDTAETNISTNTTNITNLTNRLETAETNISTNTTNITNLTNRLDTAETNISTNTTSIENINAQLSAIGQSYFVENITEDITTKTNDIVFYRTGTDTNYVYTLMEWDTESSQYKAKNVPNNTTCIVKDDATYIKTNNVGDTQTWIKNAYKTNDTLYLTNTTKSLVASGNVLIGNENEPNIILKEQTGDIETNGNIQIKTGDFYMGTTADPNVLIDSAGNITAKGDISSLNSINVGDGTDIISITAPTQEKNYTNITSTNVNGINIDSDININNGNEIRLNNESNDKSLNISCTDTNNSIIKSDDNISIFKGDNTTMGNNDNGIIINDDGLNLKGNTEISNNLIITDKVQLKTNSTPVDIISKDTNTSTVNLTNINSVSINNKEINDIDRIDNNDKTIYSKGKIDNILGNLNIISSNYNVSEILNDIPITKEADIIFVFKDNVNTLMKYENNAYVKYNNAPYGSICYVISTQTIYVRLNNDDTNQVWVKQDLIDLSQTITLSNNQTSLITNGNIEVNGSIISDELDKKLGNYSVEQIYDTKPVSPPENQIIFFNNSNNYLELIQYIDNSWVDYNVSIGSICLVKNTGDVYIKNDNISNHQNWIKYNALDTSATLHLTNANTSLETDGDIKVNNNIILKKDGEIITNKLSIIGNNNNETTIPIITKSENKVNINNVDSITCTSGTISNEPTENNNIANKSYVDKSKGNYHVNSIVNTEPQNPENNEIILKQNEDYLSLRIYNGTTWEDYDVAIGSICIVEDTRDIYIRLTDINNHQNWQYTEINISEINNITNFYPALIQNDISIRSTYKLYNSINTIEESKFLVYPSEDYKIEKNTNYTYEPLDGNLLILRKQNNPIVVNFYTRDLDTLTENYFYYSIYETTKMNCNIDPYDSSSENYHKFLQNKIYLYKGKDNNTYNFIECERISYDFSFDYVIGNKYISYNTEANPAFINNTISKNKIYLCTEIIIDSNNMSFTFTEIEPINKQIVHCLKNGQQLLYYKDGENNENWITLGVGKIDCYSSTGEIFNNYDTNIASGDYSHAEGGYTKALGNYSHAEGYYTSALANGGSHAEGANTIASGFGSHAEGGITIASGSYSHAEGQHTIANDAYSHAEGQQTTASGRISHAEGFQTIASGDNTHAEGNNTTASGDNTHAEGYHTTAIGKNSHAEGNNTTASGDNTHAEGYHTTAIGKNSHAEGNATQAGLKKGLTIYSNCHAEGYNTKAIHDNTHAGGSNTIADKPCMTAIGQYNIYDETDSTLNNGKLFVVGNGTANTARSDAFVVKDTGECNIKGIFNVNDNIINYKTVSNTSFNTYTSIKLNLANDQLEEPEIHFYKTVSDKQTGEIRYSLESSISLTSHSSGNAIKFNTDYIQLNNDIIHPTSLSKSKNSDPVIISVCDDLTNMYMLKQENTNFIIDKYTSFDKHNKLFEFTTENTIYNIYYFNDYLLILSNNSIDYINILNEELELINLLEDTNINKIVIDPNNNQFYILYNSYDYFSKYIINDNNEFIKSDCHVFTSENGYNPEDLNIIDMKFYDNYIYFIHPLYKDNDKYYIVYSNYTEEEIIRKQSTISFTNEYYYIDSYVYDENIYFLITKNGSTTEFIKINKDDVNDYNIYEDIINDNITQYNKNIYYKYNDNHFYLVSNNYIYYFNIEDNIIQLENKLYADECKYITYNQDTYISNTEIKYIGGGAIFNGNILLNGTIKTSTINAAQLNIQNIDVNVNKTIIHNTLIDGDIDNYKVGEPIFIKGNETYSLQRKSSDGKYPIYEYIKVTNYTNSPINQIPMVTNENNGKFIGVITAIYPANTPLKINDITSNYIKIDNNTIDFATHGDYIFKVDDNTIVHQTTSGGSKIYEVGDEIMYDGTIIDENTAITRKQEKNIVGIITFIPTDNTDYVSVFKK